MRPDWEKEYVEFISARLPTLHRQAFLLTGDGHRADDLVQQTCTNLYVYWRRARAADNLDAYVRAMLLKAFLNEKRRAWSRREQLTGEVPDLTGSSQPDTAGQMALRRALDQVPPRQRAVLVLRFLYDLPVDEVAQLLRCSPGTVKSQSSHGLSALRRLLGEDKLRSFHAGV